MAVHGRCRATAIRETTTAAVEVRRKHSKGEGQAPSKYQPAPTTVGGAQEGGRRGDLGRERLRKHCGEVQISMLGGWIGGSRSRPQLLG